MNVSIEDKRLFCVVFVVSKLPVLVSKLSNLPSNVEISLSKLPVFVSSEDNLPLCEPEVVSNEFILSLCEPVVVSIPSNLVFNVVKSDWISILSSLPFIPAFHSLSPVS